MSRPTTDETQGLIDELQAALYQAQHSNANGLSLQLYVTTIPCSKHKFASLHALVASAVAFPGGYSMRQGSHAV